MMQDVTTQLAPRERTQPMRGFDPEYADIVHYIIRCTHRIWEEKAVGLIYTHYRHNAVIHLPFGAVHGREAVVVSTLQTLLAFPDRRLYGDAVVWSGDDQAGFYSSHRITNTGTNTGPTAWGPATGRRCAWRGIADCVVLENQICEEWLVRDDMGLCRQLGFDPDTVARALAAADAAAGVQPMTAGLARDIGQLPPPAAPRPGATEAGATLAWFLDEVWNGRRLDRVREMYAPAAVLHGPNGRTLHGAGEIALLPLQVLAALPDAALLVEHVATLPDPLPASLGNAGQGAAVAVRWRLLGSHGGPGMFGSPTGAPVQVLGISHYRVVDGRVAEEWTMFDELSVRRQIFLWAGA